MKIGASMATVDSHTDGFGEIRAPSSKENVTGRIAYVRFSVFSTGDIAARLNYTRLIQRHEFRIQGILIHPQWRSFHVSVESFREKRTSNLRWSGDA